jgi:serine O-acetyltransferase
MDDSPAILSIAEALRADARSHMRHSSDFSAENLGTLRLLSTLLTPPLLCSLVHRIAHRLWVAGLHAPSRALARLNLLVHKAWISPDSRIGAGLYIPHTAGIVFEGHAGRDLVLFANCLVGAGPALRGRPVLGDGVVIGAFAVVTGGVRIGDGARLAPGSVVDVDVPDGCMAASIQRRRGT